jgi:hypothetical protein
VYLHAGPCHVLKNRGFKACPLFLRVGLLLLHIWIPVPRGCADYHHHRGGVNSLHLRAAVRGGLPLVVGAPP